VALEATRHPFKIVEHRNGSSDLYSGVGFALSLRDDDDEEEAAEPSGHPPVVSPEDVGAAVLRKLLDMTAAYLGHRQASGRAVKGWMAGCH